MAAAPDLYAEKWEQDPGCSRFPIAHLVCPFLNLQFENCAIPSKARQFPIVALDFCADKDPKDQHGENSDLSANPIFWRSTIINPSSKEKVVRKSSNTKYYVRQNGAYRPLEKDHPEYQSMERKE